VEIFDHAQGHSRVVTALQFQVNQIAIDRLAEKVQPEILYLGQLHVQPLRGGRAG
jgi:hypothetical protein